MLRYAWCLTLLLPAALAGCQRSSQPPSEPGGRPASQPADQPTGLPGSFDWPQWQGPDRNAVSKETGLLKEWPKDGPPVMSARTFGYLS